MKNSKELHDILKQLGGGTLSSDIKTEKDTPRAVVKDYEDIVDGVTYYLVREGSDGGLYNTEAILYEVMIRNARRVLQFALPSPTFVYYNKVNDPAAPGMKANDMALAMALASMEPPVPGAPAPAAPPNPDSPSDFQWLTDWSCRVDAGWGGRAGGACGLEFQSCIFETSIAVIRKLGMK